MQVPTFGLLMLIMTTKKVCPSILRPTKSLSSFVGFLQNKCKIKVLLPVNFGIRYLYGHISMGMKKTVSLIKLLKIKPNEVSNMLEFQQKITHRTNLSKLRLSKNIMFGTKIGNFSGIGSL